MTIVYFSRVSAEMGLGKCVNEFGFEPLPGIDQFIPLTSKEDPQPTYVGMSPGRWFLVVVVPLEMLPRN